MEHKIALLTHTGIQFLNGPWFSGMKTGPFGNPIFPLDAYMISCPTWSKNLGRTLIFNFPYLPTIAKNSIRNPIVTSWILVNLVSSNSCVMFLILSVLNWLSDFKSRTDWLDIKRKSIQIVWEKFHLFIHSLTNLHFHNTSMLCNLLHIGILYR